jgi:uncharacterized protein (DUF1919 family)
MITLAVNIAFSFDRKGAFILKQYGYEYLSPLIDYFLSPITYLFSSYITE